MALPLHLLSVLIMCMLLGLRQCQRVDLRLPCCELLLQHVLLRLELGHLWRLGHCWKLLLLLLVLCMHGVCGTGGVPPVG